MRLPLVIPSVLSVALLLGACSGPAPLSVVTYNAGLAVGFVPGAEERSAGTSAAVAALAADVVCVQEYWDAAHVATLEQAAAQAFPYRHFPAPSQEIGPDPGCTAQDIEPLITCMADECGDACMDDLPGCLLDSCGLQFLGLEADCMRCVQANVGSTPEEIEATCTTEATEYAYGGSFGTGILSAHPIVEADEVVFESTTNRRSLLHAVVDAPIGQLDVYCTHLTAVFSVVPYPREDGSWADEQLLQAQRLVQYVDAEGATGRAVVLGDMNAGPAVGTNDSEQLPTWETLLEGMEAPYIDQDERCTFCPENDISSVDSDARGKVIDHVLLSGFDGETSADRVLDAALDIESCGEPIPGAHSDHYGVVVTIEP
jgi:endonuclease/exonuclease/phosphatase family metal-dependent hydrolase